MAGIEVSIHSSEGLMPAPLPLWSLSCPLLAPLLWSSGPLPCYPCLRWGGVRWAAAPHLPSLSPADPMGEEHHAGRASRLPAFLVVVCMGLAWAGHGEGWVGVCGETIIPPAAHSVFWDLYCAAPDRREACDHSSEAKAFQDYVSLTPGTGMGRKVGNGGGGCMAWAWVWWAGCWSPCALH